MNSEFGMRVVIGREDVTPYVEEGMGFSNVDPGGYEVAHVSFPRNVKVGRGLPVLITDGLETAWAGRVQRAGRKLAGGSGSTVACEGHGARFKDEPVQEIWRDIDFSHWSGASVQRRINNDAAGNATRDPAVQGDATSGEPALRTGWDSEWPSTDVPTCEALYDSGGIPLGSLYYAWKKGAHIGAGPDSWQWDAFLAVADTIQGGSDTTDDLQAAGPGSGRLAATNADRVFAMVRLLWNAATGAGGAQQTYDLWWTTLAVYGRHGLLLRGSEPAAGFYPSDIARDVLRRVSGVREGVITEASSFLVPHALAPDPVEAQRIIAEQALLAGGWHWGTWAATSIFDADPVFDFRPLPEAASCFTTRSELEQLDLEEDLSRLYERALISYQDSAGTSRTIERRRDVPELAEADVGERTLVDSLGEGNQAAAETYGDFLLALSERAARASGSAVAAAPVRLPGGGIKAAHLLRAGIDKLKIGELPELPLFAAGRDEFQLKRVDATVGKKGVETRLEVGLGADLREVLHARLQLATQVATFGR